MRHYVLNHLTFMVGMDRYEVVDDIIVVFYLKSVKGKEEEEKKNREIKIII